MQLAAQVPVWLPILPAAYLSLLNAVSERLLDKPCKIAGAVRAPYGRMPKGARLIVDLAEEFTVHLAHLSKIIQYHTQDRQ